MTLPFGLLLLVHSKVFQGFDLVLFGWSTVDPDGFDAGMAEQLGDGHLVRASPYERRAEGVA